MKKILLLFSFFLSLTIVHAQSDREKIERACLDYIEGFYEGDTMKLAKSLNPALQKWGYWKNDSTGVYNYDGQMTYRQAIDYAKRVFDNKRFAKPGSAKKVEVLDVMPAIASAKVTAWWGVDYILLAKPGDKWLIEQVLWQGPLAK